MNIRPAIKSQLNAIKERLAQLPAALVEGAQAGWAAAELDAERRALLRTQRELAEQMQRPVSSPADARRLTERQVQFERELEAHRLDSLHAAARFEQQGDHRQARIWREHALSIPEHLKQQFGAAS